MATGKDNFDKPRAISDTEYSYGILELEQLLGFKEGAWEDNGDELIRQ